jgi:ribonucleoside-diphosphate reductase alpha chain
VFFKLRLPFDGEGARKLSKRISERIYLQALKTSCELAREFGAHPGFPDTRAAAGELQFDSWGVSPEEQEHWRQLKDDIKAHGLRNSLLVAIAPTATIASIAGCYECIEPQLSNLFKRETLSGDFIQINSYLINELKALGLWSEATRDAVKAADGSVQKLAVPEELKAIYRTAWELPMKALLEMAADRGAFIDQSQSLNLFIANPNIGQLSSMYMYAWKLGLKTTYYLRSRPATRISKTTISEPSGAAASGGEPPGADAPGALARQNLVACSLENPQSCEACQ